MSVAAASQVALDEGHLDHTAEVEGGLLEARQNAATFLQPADQPLHDVASAIGLGIERHLACVRGLVAFWRDYRLDAEALQILVNPVGSIAFVAGQLQREEHRLVVEIAQRHAFEQRFERLRFVGLAGRDAEVQRIAVPVAQQMDLG